MKKCKNRPTVKVSHTHTTKKAKQVNVGLLHNFYRYLVNKRIAKEGYNGKELSKQYLLYLKEKENRLDKIVSMATPRTKYHPIYDKYTKEEIGGLWK